MTDSDSDSEAGVYRTEFDAEEEVCYAIVSALGSVIDDDPVAVEPLYNVVDPDALETFVRSLRTRNNTDNGSVRFGLNDRLVTVRADGVLEIRPDRGGLEGTSGDGGGDA